MSAVTSESGSGAATVAHTEVQTRARTARRPASRYALHTLLLVLSFFYLLPFAWMILKSSDCAAA